MPFADNNPSAPFPPNPYLADPDVRLMLEFKQGEQASFEKLMHKYHPALLNFIYRFVGNPQTAEDLTQEVFLRVYDKASSYQPQSKFQTWIFTIAKHLSLNELRRSKKRGVSLDEPLVLEEGSAVRQVADEHSECPDEAVSRKETVAAVRAAIEALPENQRMAVILRRYEKFSYEDIARTMGLSVKAVKSLLSRAKENLKNKLMNTETFS